ncbi:hypothetical protein AVEN_249622-1 [Araneus ventricosus]|uniref:Uncharacterized protein n=1 Tax=Araneus ventricosus TaxID=182803 RepID=A0A4Y2TW21_ARAVE|nr:hypothetical protein AVEN_249622-1 [Araneus ventricosus]
MKLVFRRPDLRSQRSKSTKKIEPSLVSVLFRGSLPKISPFSSLALSFNSHRPPTGGRSIGISTNPRQFCRWSPPQRAIIGSSPFLGLSFCRKRFLRPEIIYPFHHIH